MNCTCMQPLVVGATAVLVAAPAAATVRSMPDEPAIEPLLYVSEKAMMTPCPNSVAANTLVNVNEVPGLAGAMAQRSELVLSAPVSSTSWSLVHTQLPDDT